MTKTNLILIAIFAAALFLRFLYFPNNIYFGIDQARDAYVSKGIWSGDFKIVGPPTSVEGLFHGPLYYYIFAPIYFFSEGNPEAVSAFLRIFNALGVFIVYLIGSAIFNRKTGLIAAFLYALSFEQTQFAIYLNHPSLAVISVMVFYLGLALLFFKKDPRGFLIASIGLGLSIQFELAESYLIVSFLTLLFVFREKLNVISKKIFIISFISFLLITSSFLATEVKFGFSATRALTSGFFQNSSGVPYFKNLEVINIRTINDNLISGEPQTRIIALLFIFGIALFIYKGAMRKEMIFLLVWFFSGNLPYYKDTNNLPLYYHIAGSTVAILLLSAYFISKFSKYSKVFLLILIIPAVSNLKLMTEINPYGSIPAINVQSGMLLSDQKKAIDYAYQKSEGKDFSVYGLTMPLYINMTWSYLFNWYGRGKYGYLPVWGGENAPGYYNDLKVQTARSELPKKRFFIIEPTRGIPGYFIDEFKNKEEIFTSVFEEKSFGKITIQYRKPR